jgi:hypothetical protein
MLPNFLFPEQTVTDNGEGPTVDLGDAQGTTLQLTLGITDLNEQVSLDVMIHGSVDGEDWSAKPLTAFPQKFYKGVYSIFLDLSDQPEIRSLKVKYKTHRWGHWTEGPRLVIYVFAETLVGV